jgi:hypothetical protein
VFNTGFSAVGNRDGWNPIFRDERTYSLPRTSRSTWGATTCEPATP